MTATCKTCEHYEAETYQYKNLSLGLCGNELVCDAWKFPERTDCAMAGDEGFLCGPDYWCIHHQPKESGDGD